MTKQLNAILYHNIYSPPSRMAYLVAKNIDVDLTIRDLDIYSGEQNKPEFLRINPMHQVPVLVHEDFVVTEGRAIMIYLATVADSSLYTTSDLRKKTLIESRMFFDATNASLAVKNFVFPVLKLGVKIVPIQHRDALKNLLKNCEILLQDSEYFAGNELTIADFGFLAYISTIKAFGADLSEHPKLNVWYEKCKKLPGGAENEEGAKLLAEKVRNHLNEPLWI